MFLENCPFTFDLSWSIDKVMNTKHPARRQEFLTDEGLSCLSRSQYGVLATVDPDGWPEARPLNFVVYQQAVWFHTSFESSLTRRLEATFTACCDLSWIPSYWRNPHQACPATTYYTSVVARGRLQVATDLALKAEIFAKLLEKYQPEGGYVPFDHADKLYAGPLAEVCLVQMSIDDLCCKSKYGQHLTLVNKLKILQGLNNRGDWATAELMRRHNLDIPIPEGYSNDASAMKAEEIFELLRHEHWADRRPLDVVAKNCQTALVQWGYFEGGRLRAYLRVESMWLYDVVVDQDFRGCGIGRRLLEHLMGDARVAALPRLGLSTSTAETLYHKFGFVTVGVGPSGSLVMMHPRRVEPQPVAAG